jgi:uncharacterized short protein YbdD (DUF466 family)
MFGWRWPACATCSKVPNHTYAEHMRRNHPDRPVMSYAEFFRERQNARYGGDGRGGFRCC